MASFGETLRRERELRGIDLRDVAEATKISVRFLQALEDDRIDVLPGGIFPRAFVRQYATYLGPRSRADGGRVRVRVRRAGRRAAAAAARHRRARPRVRRGFVVAGLLAAGALALLAWPQGRAADARAPSRGGRRPHRRRSAVPAGPRLSAAAHASPPAPPRGQRAQGLVLDLHGRARAAGSPCRPTA